MSGSGAGSTRRSTSSFNAGATFCRSVSFDLHARVRRVYTVAVHHRPATSGHGGLAFSVGEAPFHFMYATSHKRTCIALCIGVCWGHREGNAPRQTERTETVNTLITSADQLNWINLNEVPLDNWKRIEAPGADLTARIDDDNLLAIYIDVIDDEVRVTMNRIFGEVYFSSDDPGEWTDIEAVLPRRLWPAQVWAGSKWAGKERQTYPAINAAIAAKLADYKADSE
nr:MAG TPA: hypothetical protein [Caudoviricetes sp.]